MMASGPDEIVATLPFGLAEEPASEGILVLYGDGTIQLVPSDQTRTEFQTFTDKLSHQAVSWGASFVVGLAGLGSALWLRQRKQGAWILFGLSGLSGIAGAYARRESGRVAASLTQRHLLGRTASVRRSRGGGITLEVREPGLPPWSVTLSMEELDPQRIDAFLRSASAA